MKVSDSAVLTLTFDDEEASQLEELAKEQNRSPEDIVSEFVRQMLDFDEKEMAAPDN